MIRGVRQVMGDSSWMRTSADACDDQDLSGWLCASVSSAAGACPFAASRLNVVIAAADVSFCVLAIANPTS
jgi:hypothetical protein